MNNAINSAKTEQARIYLADRRHSTQTSLHRSLNTFGSGSHPADPDGFHILRTLNDETLAPGATATYRAHTRALVAVIPLVGACVCTIRSKPYTPDAGQVLIDAITPGDILTFQNPFSDESINYLMLEIRGETPASAGVTDVALDYPYNTLHRLAASPACHILVGAFQGREEVMLPFDMPGKKIFVFVLEGAFEVNHRLLHRRDGLALSDCTALACEALSNHAMLMVIEFF
jgi:hypothetical protein